MAETATPDAPAPAPPPAPVTPPAPSAPPDPAPAPSAPSQPPAPSAPASKPADAPPAPSTPDPAAPPAAEAFDPAKLVKPANALVPDAEVRGIAEKAKTLGLTQVQAQRLVDDRNQEYIAWQAENARAFEALKNDPVLGGANFDATKTHVNRALDFGHTSEQAARVREKLAAAGLDNDIDIVRWVSSIGRARAEDRPTIAPAGKPEEIKHTKEVLFGSSTKAS